MLRAQQYTACQYRATPPMDFLKIGKSLFRYLMDYPMAIPGIPLKLHRCRVYTACGSSPMNNPRGTRYTRAVKILMIEDDLTIGRALLTAFKEEGHQAVWVRL